MTVSHCDYQANGALAADWTPAVDIIERADRFELTADLPGVRPEDIDVSLDGRLLRLSGVRDNGVATDRRNLDERSSGRFCRRFTLPVSVDGERIVARAQHGTLQLSVPKVPEVLPRRITIDAH
jgi:HSP20 family protein